MSTRGLPKGSDNRIRKYEEDWQTDAIEYAQGTVLVTAGVEGVDAHAGWFKTADGTHTWADLAYDQNKGAGGGGPITSDDVENLSILQGATVTDALSFVDAAYQPRNYVTYPLVDTDNVILEGNVQVYTLESGTATVIDQFDVYPTGNRLTFIAKDGAVITFQPAGDDAIDGGADGDPVVIRGSSVTLQKTASGDWYTSVEGRAGVFKWIGTGGGNTGVVVKNTLGTTFSITYSGPGDYRIIADAGNPFVADKTTATVQVINDNSGFLLANALITSETQCRVSMSDVLGVDSDPPQYQVIIEVEA